MGVPYLIREGNGKRLKEPGHGTRRQCIRSLEDAAV